MPPGAAQPLPGYGAVRPSRRCGAGCAAASDHPSTSTSRTRARVGLEAPAGSPGGAARLQGGRRASAALDRGSASRPTVGGSAVWLPRALHRITAAPMRPLQWALPPANRTTLMASRLGDGRCVPASQGPLLASRPFGERHTSLAPCRLDESCAQRDARGGKRAMRINSAPSGLRWGAAAAAAAACGARPGGHGRRDVSNILLGRPA